MDFYSDIESYFTTLKKTIDATNKQEINRVLQLLSEAYHQEKLIFTMGNGGSAATASHMANDFNKGISYGRDKKFKVISLCDNISTLMAIANDVSYEAVFEEQLKNFLRPGDLVIGISGSGNSENVLRAIEYANTHQAITIGLTGYTGGKLKQSAKNGIHVEIMDMQITEDLHMILNHLFMKALDNHL